MNKWRLLTVVLLFSCGVVNSYAQKPNTTSPEIVNIEGRDFYLHKVVKGETLYSLSKLYKVTTGDIERDNPSVAKLGLKFDETIKIACREIKTPKLSTRKYARTFSEHEVAQGETIYSIARRYGISMAVLLSDNPGIDIVKLSIGQQLRIRKSEVGEVSPHELRTELDSYASKMTSVSEGWIYYVVDLGETVYSISRKLGVTERYITDNNDLSKGLQAGVVLKIPNLNIGAAENADSGEQYDQSHQTDEYMPEKLHHKTNTMADDLLQILDEYGEKNNSYNIPDFRLRREGYLNISMLLPLTGEGVSSSSQNNFIEFYQGALLALESLKEQGYSVDFKLYDTQRSADKVYEIVNSPEFASTDIIIGPVYEDVLPPVIEFAQTRNIPIVSPLATLSKDSGGVVYQLAPSVNTQYDKLKEFLTSEKNIVFITSNSTDVEFDKKMTALIGEVPYQRIMYDKDAPVADMAALIDSHIAGSGVENLFVVVSGVESADLILAAISSVQNNRLARSVRTGQIRVIGNTKWLRNNSIDKHLFFKLNVSLVTNYFAERSNGVVGSFYDSYMKSFRATPTLYSFRGYDSVKVFAEAMLKQSEGGNFNLRLNRSKAPLQAKYYFMLDYNGALINTEWVRVTYHNNYTITVK